MVNSHSVDGFEFQLRGYILAQRSVKNGMKIPTPHLSQLQI